MINYIKTLLIVISTLITYILTMKAFGGPMTNPPQLLTEMPIIATLSLLFGLALKKSRFRWVFACIPILIFYLIIDIYYILFNRVFHWAELQELPEMFSVIPVEYLIVLWAPAIIPLGVYIFQISTSQVHKLCAPLLVVFAAYYWIQFNPQSYIEAYTAVSKRVAQQNEPRTVKNNGRLLTTMYFEASRQRVLSSLYTLQQKPLHSLESYNSRVAALKNNKRNLHIIVMESYINPKNFPTVKFNKPLDPKNFEWLSQFASYSISPVFGGHTPQTEFEILCGTQAKSSYSSVEFNLFTGSITNCLPQWLRENGYNTIASHAHSTRLFNRVKAYPSLGFSEIYFPKEYSHTPNTYLYKNTELRNGLMFDGDLFDQNLAFIRDKLKEGKPILNYLLGVYGHSPHLVDYERFPLAITPSVDSDLLQKVANEYMYRTNALNKYLTKLIELDPDSMILVVSDHLPPLDGRLGIYDDLQFQSDMNRSLYQNLVYIIDRSIPIEFDGTHHFQILDFVLNKMTDNNFCEEIICANDGNERYLHSRYKEIIAQAIGTNYFKHPLIVSSNEIYD